MAEFESLSRGWDHLGNIERTLGDLYGSPTAIYELIQNADDAAGATRMHFVVTDEALEVWNDGVFERCTDVTSVECEWLARRRHRCDFHSFRKMASGDKRNRPGTTGAFGVGFTAVYQFTDRPELLSNGEHWFVDEMAPEQDRIQRVRTSVGDTGTTFRLPWAIEPSPFREAINQKPVSREAIASFIDELLRTIPHAMPFLKKLQTIQASDGRPTTTFTRWSRDRRIGVRSDNGECYEWLLLEGDFSFAAADLKAAHHDVIEEARSSEVRIAIPITEDTESGLLYATLPTEEPAHLPLLINADFVPASDRKRIRFDSSPVSEWNRAAVRTAAELLSASLEHLAAGIGDQAFVRLLIAARELHERLVTEGIEPAFGAFWRSILTAIPTAQVAPIETGGYGTVGAVRLWAEDAELASAPLLNYLGVHLVDHRVRADWYRLRGGEIGMRNLHLADVTAALRGNGLTKRWATSERSGKLADEEALQALWTLLDVLLQIRDRSSHESRESLLHCAVAPGSDGAIWPIRVLYRGDQEAQDLFADAGVRVTFLDVDRLGPQGARLADLVEPATLTLSLTWVEEALVKSGSDVAEADRRRLLQWFFERHAHLADSEAVRLARLAIFPTASGSKPLVGLALPGDFKDELGLARVVSVDAIEEMRAFLAKLGAKRLTFTRYCTDFVAEAVESQDLTDEQRRRLLGLLVTRLSEVRDDHDVHSALRPLDLVVCTDGQWRTGDEVYLTGAVSTVLGSDVPIARIPVERKRAHQEFYRWLGATDEPRPSDVEARCHQLRSGPEKHRPIAEAIIGYVGQQFAADRDRVAGDYASLRNIPWLPAEGDRSRGYAPNVLYNTYQKTLFASQARFLDIPLPVQRENAGFLRWLGVQYKPQPKQVVDHLVSSAKRGERVGDDMWIYLNQNAADPALDALRHQRCLLIAETGTYVKPTEVYWGSHPFGRFRYKLGPKFTEYQALLNRLGVPQQPAPSDAVDVLQEVAARHSGERAPLLDDDVLVVQACWRLLSEGLESEAIITSQFAELAAAEVVLDARHWLHIPGDVFFRDSESLADRFGPAVHSHLIDRPEGLWMALSAAGVRNLSDAVDTRIVEHQPDEAGGVAAARLHERRRLVLRVLAADDHQAAHKVQQFEQNTKLSRLTQLVIEQAIEFEEELHLSKPYDRSALYFPDDQTLFYVENGGALVWVEFARELTRALDVDGSRASGVAAAIKGVLDADSEEAARRELDELGFRALDAAVTAEAAPTVAADLGESPTGDEEEGAADGAASSHATDTDDWDEGRDTSSASRIGAEAVGHRDGGTSRETSGGLTEGEHGPDGESSAKTAGAGSRSSEAAAASRGTAQSRLRSYVVPVGVNGRAAGSGSESDARVERAGVDAVLEFERTHGREAKEMPPQNPGFDIRSVDADGRVRIIEVKATVDVWGARGVAISSTQFDSAQQRREEFWLYVVDQALTSPRVHPINDPASKIDQYLFDDGWRAEVESADEPSPELPALRLPTSPDGVPGAVPFLAVEAGVEEPPTYWVACAEQERRDTWFAIRIEGDALGLAYRGGIAYVEPLDRQPSDDELVSVILHEQIDPDSGRRATVRMWRPERDLAGNHLGLRLWSNGSVEPLTVSHPDHIKVCGIVRASMRASDLEDLGYC